MSSEYSGFIQILQTEPPEIVRKHRRISLSFGGLEGMMIGRKDVEEVLRATFAFSAAFYDRIDQFRRHERFLHGVALSGLQHKKWVEEVRPTNQISMSMRQHPEPLLLLPEPRVVSRDGLRRPEPEVERIITYARRELEREL